MATQYLTEQKINGNGYDADVSLDPYNSRIILSKCAGHKERAIERLIELCAGEQLGKIIYFANKGDKDIFQREGFVEEGIIENFYKGEDAYCLSYFYDPKRKYNEDKSKEDEIITKALQTQSQDTKGKSNDYLIRIGQSQDVEAIANLFAKVFDTYPTPMNDEKYIKKVLDNKIRFVVAEDKEGFLASVASADMKKDLGNAEITDCATKQEHRGRGLMSQLVWYLEKQLTHEGFRTLYSLARALSPGVNIVFRRGGYDYTGRMVKNCNIMGKFEDMNIWVKKLN